MAFLCPARARRAFKKRKVRRNDGPMPGRITGSASIDTLVRVGLEKEDLQHEGRPIARVLHDFSPCVEDELCVRRGQEVTLLYRENDWVYVLAQDRTEGFIPFVYCAVEAPRDALRVSNTKLSTTNGAHTPPRENSNLRRTSSVSLPSLNDLGDTKPENRMVPQTSDASVGAAEVQAADDTVSSSNASDTPLLAAESFAKRPCGRYIVLFQFHSLEENDVSVSRGEFVTVLNCEDPDWYWIGRSDGREGFVPSRFLCAADGSGSGALETAGSGCVSKKTTVATSPSPLADRGQETCLIVLYDYHGRAADDLSVRRGDIIYANLNPSAQTERDWLWACHPRPDRWGFIPRTYARRASLAQDTAGQGQWTVDEFMSP